MLIYVLYFAVDFCFVGNMIGKPLKASGFYHLHIANDTVLLSLLPPPLLLLSVSYFLYFSFQTFDYFVSMQTMNSCTTV